MILTIGYAALHPGDLMALATRLNARIVDVRSMPSSRRPGFGGRQLAALLGDRYEWAGRTLGGRCPITPGAIEALAARHRAGERLILLCLEESPAECHRHAAIAWPLEVLGVPVYHLYRGEVLRAHELERAARDGTDYECWPWSLPGSHSRASAARTSSAL